MSGPRKRRPAYIPRRLDSDIDPNYLFDPAQHDAEISACVQMCKCALGRSNKLSKPDAPWLGSILEGMLDTHKAIRLLVGKKVKDATSVEAMSLVREQIETVFAVALISQEPAKYLRLHRLDGVRKAYTYAEQVFKEQENLPRFDAAYRAEMRAIWTDHVRALGMNEDQIATIIFEATGDRLPAGRHYDAVEEFPTPGQVLKKVDSRRKVILERLYRMEYGYYCAFPHVTSVATLHKGILRGEIDHLVESKGKDVFFDKQVAGPAVDTSSNLVLVAATEGYCLCRDEEIDLAAKLTQTWESLKEAYLFTRALWPLRPQSVLHALS
jgi:hypothetical protein